ncbi:hypothetical protein DL89DRAFT_112676 [Linderina pennispora]|uniref:Uncharacterized protein n=1 Tax=Linderina pennispora TaxID=61395 RepID=A0A1Y1WFY2_9FUNG|nr:uncharacterized protein DL89DRAFT_112676 [Linderina pennispora]ORX72392.1 hypothetical protein DL89DRAFT_112676 [Linderina pennispora]
MMTADTPCTPTESYSAPPKTGPTVYPMLLNELSSAIWKPSSLLGYTSPMVDIPIGYRNPDASPFSSLYVRTCQSLLAKKQYDAAQGVSYRTDDHWDLAAADSVAGNARDYAGDEGAEAKHGGYYADNGLGGQFHVLKEMGQASNGYRVREVVD